MSQILTTAPARATGSAVGQYGGRPPSASMAPGRQTGLYVGWAYIRNHRVRNELHRRRLIAAPKFVATSPGPVG